MIANLYLLILIFITLLISNFLIKSHILNKYLDYTSGFLYGILIVISIYIHYYYIEAHIRSIPLINIITSNYYLISIATFLFGLKSGVIALFLALISRIMLTKDFLFFSVLLFFLSFLVSGLFYEYKVKNYNYNTIILVLFSLINGLISLIIFFLISDNRLLNNLFSYTVYQLVLLPFIIFTIVSLSIYQKNILTELKHKDTLLTSVFHNLGEAVITLDNEFSIINLNFMAEKVTGFKLDEVKGKNFFDVLKIQELNIINLLKQQLLSGKEHIFIDDLHFTLISKSHEKIPIECNFSAIIDENSKRKVLFLVCKDLRKVLEIYKRIEVFEQRFKQFLNFTQEGIWLYEVKEPISIHLPPDEQVRLIFERGYLAECNETFVKMYGYESKDAIIGTPLSANLIPDDENNIAYIKAFIENNYCLTNAESIEKDKFGNIKYFLNSLYGVIENDCLVSAWGLQIDVTEEKLLSKQIKDNNKLLLSILNAPKGIIIFALDRNYCYTAFSISHKEVMKKIWGVDIEIGMNMLDAIKFDEDRIKAKNNFDKALNGEYLNLIEEYGDENLSRQFWIDNYSPIFDGDEIIGVAVYVTDISQQKEYEIELERKNILIQTILDNIPDSIYVKDKNLRKILTNKKDLEFMGIYEKEFVIGKTDAEIYDEEFAKRTIEDDIKVLSGIPVINREERLITKDDQEIYILTTKVPLYDKFGEIIGLVGIGRDITLRKQYLMKLQQEEEKLRIIFNQSFQFVGLLNKDGILLEANKTACDFININPDEVKGKPFVDTPWWAHSKVEQEKLINAIKIAASGNFFRTETTHINKNNEIRIIDFSLTPIKNINGEIELLIAEGRDITDVKLLQRKLLESEEKYKILIEASLDAISIINSVGQIVFENERHKNIFDLLFKGDKEKNIFNIIHEKDLEKFKSELKEIDKYKLSTVIILRVMKNENEFFWCEISLKKFIDSEYVPLIMCVIKDITLRKQLEDEMRKKVHELESYNRILIGRELKMVELKKEINSLLKQLGQPPKYADDDL